jgi:transposase-like protein
VKDICIACIDGLAGFATAIRNIFPDVTIQRCVIHQIRYSMQYVSSKDSDEFMADLKGIYQATTLEIAEENLAKLETKW